MTPISRQLTRIPATLRGDWIRRWKRNIWDGLISCDEQFVTLIIARVGADLFWAKSLPRKDDSLKLELDLLPRPDLEDRLFQLQFSCGSGGFIHNVTAKFNGLDYRPNIAAPNQFETGFIVPFATFSSRLAFSFACFAKTDVVVRRHYVWGLKPRSLNGINSPWRDMLAKGRNGQTAFQVAA